VIVLLLLNSAWVSGAGLIGGVRILAGWTKLAENEPERRRPSKIGREPDLFKRGLDGCFSKNLSTPGGRASFGRSATRAFVKFPSAGEDQMSKFVFNKKGNSTFQTTIYIQFIYVFR
jgi:hypothetical protein